jgi:glutamyl-tRNA synthetase
LQNRYMDGIHIPSSVGSVALLQPGTDGGYRGRLAPTPSGFLHAGHAATFRLAWQRARAAGGKLVYRCEDIDPDRCRPEFATAAMDDLRWFGLDWDEGPDCGGPYQPYVQSERMVWYRAVWRQLLVRGHLYPSCESRATIAAATTRRSPVSGEPLFPPALRPAGPPSSLPSDPGGIAWRFRVADNTELAFVDGACGPCSFVAGRDFGDFLVWRRDGMPSYELAVVADDYAMAITEVVRGADLLLSTARQLLLYRALGWHPPAWYHAPLVCDAAGHKLSKRSLAERARKV